MVGLTTNENIEGEFEPISPERVFEVLESGSYSSFTFTESWGHYRMTLSLLENEKFCFSGHHNFICERLHALEFLKKEGIDSSISHLFDCSDYP